VVASSLEMAAIPLDKLPTSAGAMLTSIGVQSGGRVALTAGLNLLTSVDPASPAAQLLGLSGGMVLAGSVGVTDGKPTMSLYADLPTLPMPDVLRKNPIVALDGVKPKLFMSLGADRHLALGIETAMTLRLDAKPLILDGKLYADLGAGAPGLQVSAVLRDVWADPIGLAGVTVLGNTGFSFGVSADGAAKVMFNGGASFDGRSFELGGGLSVLFSTGIPVVKGLALRFAASELGPLTPARVAQTVMRAMANAMPAGKVKDDLVKASRVDLVALTTQAIPDTQLGRYAARLAFKDVVLFLATPGMESAEFPQFNDAGIAAKGTLVLGAKTLGAFDGYLTTNKGFGIATSAADFAIGPLTMKHALLDIGFGIPGLQSTPPHFRIKGDAALDGHPLAGVDVDLSETKFAASGSLDVFGSSIAMSGDIKPTSYTLTGKGRLNLPKIDDVNLPAADASFSLSNTDGVTFGFGVTWEKASFDMSGSYTSPTDFTIKGAAAADHGTKHFDLGKLRVGTLTIEKGGGLSIKLSPGKSVVRFNGKGKFEALSITDPITKKKLWDGVTAKFDFENVKLSSDLRIRKTVRVFDITKMKEVDLEIDYRVFP
jgi:hypothetical protein